jgi:adenine-specific DNA methylase
VTLFAISPQTKNIESGSERKLRGGYYTPEPIAQFLSNWAIQSPGDRILEPSCGDGALVGPVLDQLGDSGEVVALELFENEASKVRSSHPRARVVVGDAFRWWVSEGQDATFDAVVGNPPFIRYQDFPESQRDLAFQIMRAEGLNPTRLVNAWLPFVVLATRALREGGRLAFVLPAELMQVGYSAELREYLARKFDDLHIVTFRKIVFDGIQQEVVLLLGQRRDCEQARIRVLELDAADDLMEVDLDGAPPSTIDLEHAREKWTQYYLSGHDVGLLRELAESSEVPRLSRYAEVNVGIVTGRNAYFVLARDDAADAGLTEWCHPMVGRSAQIPGLVLGNEDWKGLYARNEKVLLLNVQVGARSDLPPDVLKYVEHGEDLGYHTGYKCRIRLPAWWQIPSLWTPDAFMLRQIHDAPRIVSNRTGATCTDTIHRVRTRPGVKADQLAAASVNSMTAAFSEIHGRSYGGGVLELEPREATEIPFPELNGVLPIDELDKLAQESESASLLDAVDRHVLSPMGLTAAEIDRLRGIWNKLSMRRRERKRPK